MITADEVYRQRECKLASIIRPISSSLADVIHGFEQRERQIRYAWTWDADILPMSSRRARGYKVGTGVADLMLTLPYAFIFGAIEPKMSKKS